ncbi:MAG TPA: hypothetical protein VHA10_21875 [Hypericibacter adhaerens]|uniref:Uncharacterized protein n=1 Tax=Hypericibacter adhaerens TaxID=2602016 RepID=A0A5J6MT98_9PROT|nr:hypothetical protein FRZ61_07720 [Hypericibacter adhaerens]HWA45885.1 hypothetical protein [Hypericibacter adhaerens]
MSAVERDDETKRRQRARNWAVFAALLGFVVLVYVVSILRMGGH